MCMGAALWSRVDEIYYGARPEDAAAAGFDDKLFYDYLRHPKSDGLRKLKQIKVDNDQEPFDIWKARESKVIY
ncbi:hypothetical protein AB6A40_007086 [Gnathostoma spinigerum]|uniref:Guanine deaminase n=1 Tax=Gnathostoma spinigerum TaxID=75299 RepID=A0ABD6EUY2_9BILA